MDKRIVNLEVNDSGGWRRVSSFDVDGLEDGQLEQAASTLLTLSSSQRLTARIIIPGDTAPLTTWSKATGWRAWGATA